MAAAAAALHQPAPESVHPRQWTKAEYYRLGELGFFKGQRVELIEGTLMVLSPQNARHGNAVETLDAVVRTLFGPAYRFRCQLPLDLGQTTEPEPDFVVLPGTTGPLPPSHPTTAVLIVEVSDTSLSYDRVDKGSLYARAGVADYWIVNLVDSQVEVYRDPVPDPTQPFGFRYASCAVLTPPAVIAPLAMPQANVTVAALLP